MITRMASRAGAFVGRVFPERQIYHRADGQVRYFTLSTRTQVLTATASALALGWFSYASASVFLRGHLLSAQSGEAQQVRARYERWLAEARAREASALALLQTRTSDFEQAAQEFERRHRTLQELLEHATGGRRGGGRGVRLARADDGEAVMMTASIEDPTPRRSRLAIEAAERRADDDYVDNDRLHALMTRQDAMLDSAEERAQDRVENLRAVLRLTGLSVESILEEGDRAAGGPYISLAAGRAGGVDFDDPFARRVARVAARVAEAERLERAIDSAPLGAPVDEPYRRTSPYGARIDPVTSAPAFHAGLDMAAYRLAPINAVAPGRVSFVGWRGGYGRVVEIDHGHGFRTRYGHLHRAYVERGDEVSFGDRIAAMGSTGRSTGTHLHYEVWFKGRHYDPALFLRAGTYVHQS